MHISFEPISKRERHRMENMLNCQGDCRKFEGSPILGIAVTPGKILMVFDAPQENGMILRQFVEMPENTFPQGWTYGTAIISTDDLKRPCYLGVEVRRGYYIVYIPHEYRFKLMTKAEMRAAKVCTAIRVNDPLDIRNERNRFTLQEMPLTN